MNRSDAPSEFPVLWPYKRTEEHEWEKAGCPRNVPWAMLAPYEWQAKRHHDQTLQRLAERGGLSPCEMVAVLEGRDHRTMADGAAIKSLKKKISAYENGFVLRGTVYPNALMSKRYPLEKFPCERCEKEGLPHLVDNRSEFYWEHQHYEEGGSSARSGCPRFGETPHFGAQPRPGTACVTHFCGALREYFEQRFTL